MTFDGEAGRGPILIADDDPAILSMISLRLGARGYQVFTASDGLEALDAARDRSPRLVVLDVMMPNMTGWEVARALRQDESTRAIKIVMLTAIGAQVNELTSPLFGVDAYLDKPFDFATLEKTIADLLA
jgi:CheY-like chemotaxis protein